MSEDPSKKKMPFAGKKKSSRIYRAMLLESKLRMPMQQGLKVASEIRTRDFDDFVNRVVATKVDLDLSNDDAIELVAMVDSCNSWKEYHTKAAQMIQDENGRPLAPNEYVEIVKIAKGEAKAPLV